MKLDWNYIATILIVIVFSIGIINYGKSMSNYKQDLEEELKTANKIMGGLREDINLLDKDMFYIQGDISKNRGNIRSNNYGMSDLWFSIYYENTTTIKQFEEDNKYFFDVCIPQAEWRSVILTRNYWDDNEPIKARYLVVSYDIGEIVYDKNGTINCYTMAIDSLPVECNSLCKVEVEEE